MSEHAAVRGGTIAITVGALGVVFGDIGTSPLYAFRESLAGEHDLAVSEANVLGVLSLMFWSLIIVITIKYLLIVMRADNNGEGGILALGALVTGGGRRNRVLVLLALFGTALLYGDGMITPAISVLSAVEGVEVAAPSVDHFVVPIVVIILVALFAVQRHGTETIGRFFGPVMLVWFSVLTVLGLRELVTEPRVLKALNPILCGAVLHRQRWTWLPGARVGLPRRHRRRGAVRRHGSLRAPTNPTRLVPAGVAGVGRQLSRTGCPTAQ